MSDLVAFLCLLPFLSAALIGLANERFTLSVLLTQIVLSIAGAIKLYFSGGGELRSPLFFMREEIYFSLHQIPLLIFISLLIILGILTFVYLRGERTPLSKFQACLLCLSLPFGFIAFVSGQFMIRYMALDIVGLLIAATALGSFSERWRMQEFKFVFIVLRFGDLLLLSAILLLQSHAQTLEISAMISRAAELPVGVSVWIYVCFLLATMVKMGASPFDAWIRRARKWSNPVVFWLSGLLMPALGYYLLYRILPIRESHPLFQWITFFLGLISIGLIFTSNIRKPASDPFSRTNGLYSALLLCVVAFETPAHLGWYVVGLLLIRLVFIVFSKANNYSLILRMAFPFLVNLLFILGNLSSMALETLIGWFILSAVALLIDWRMNQRLLKDDPAIGSISDVPSGYLVKPALISAVEDFALWINRSVEKDIMTAGFEKTKLGIVGLAGWLAKNIEYRFDPIMDWLGERLMRSAEIEKQYDYGIDWIGEQFVALAKGSLEEFETKPQQRSSEALDEALHSMADYEDKRVKKSFRQDLIWIPLFLIFVLFFMIVLVRG